MPIEELIQHAGRCMDYSRDAIYWLGLGTITLVGLGYIIYYIGGEVGYQIKSFYDKHIKNNS